MELTDEEAQRKFRPMTRQISRLDAEVDFKSGNQEGHFITRNYSIHLL